MDYDDLIVLLSQSGDVRIQKSSCQDGFDYWSVYLSKPSVGITGYKSLEAALSEAFNYRKNNV